MYDALRPALGLAPGPSPGLAPGPGLGPLPGLGMDPRARARALARACLAGLPQKAEIIILDTVWGNC